MKCLYFVAPRSGLAAKHFIDVGGKLNLFVTRFSKEKI